MCLLGFVEDCNCDLYLYEFWGFISHHTDLFPIVSWSIFVIFGVTTQLPARKWVSLLMRSAKCPGSIPGQAPESWRGGQVRRGSHTEYREMKIQIATDLLSTSPGAAIMWNQHKNPKLTCNVPRNGTWILNNPIHIHNSSIIVCLDIKRCSFYKLFLHILSLFIFYLTGGDEILPSAAWPLRSGQVYVCLRWCAQKQGGLRGKTNSFPLSLQWQLKQQQNHKDKNTNDVR